MELYQQVLQSAGFPTDVLVLDWETYADDEYNLRKKDIYYPDYVADDRFEILGLGYHRLPEQGKPSMFMPAHDPGHIEEIVRLMKHWYGDNLERCTVSGQNLFFDLLVLREKYGITPRYTVDTLDLSRHLDARDRHDLGHNAKKYGAAKPKGDTKRFFGLRPRTMVEKDWQDIEEYCCGDIDITAYLLKLLLPKITRPNVELRLACQTLRMFLDPHITIDMELGERLARDMTAEITNVVEATRKHSILSVLPPSPGMRRPPKVRMIEHEDISKNGLFSNLLRQALPEGEDIPMKQGKNEMIPAFSKDDDGCKHLLAHSVPAVRDLMEARLAIKSWPTHIKRVKRIMRQALCRDGMFGIPLKYYGGHTGRYSGAGGVNAQNFGARDVHELIKQVGKMLRAEYGYLMGTGDLSQIEARKIAWLAGQTDLVDQFAAGVDIYSDFAQNNIFHQETRKPTDEEWENDPEFAKQLSIRRDFGKEVILACGYGMGGTTFYIRCRQNKGLRPLFDNGTYDAAFCHHLVKLYRGRYTKIISYWGELERAFRFVTKYPDQTTKVMHNGHGIEFYNENDITILRLPSGRCMFYPKARVDAEGKLSYTTGKVKYHLYGGKLAENVTQASARDVFGDGLLRLEDNGFIVLFSVHDQAITLIRDDDQAEERLAEMHRLQTVIEPWYEGLPVATEGKLVKCYEK